MTIAFDPFMFWYLTGCVFFFGACTGSFLNVCIYRIPRGESVVHPRSHCPHCGKMIVWHDNIPLFSFLILGARCRHCRGPIAPRYFLVELLTAILFTLVWFRYGVDARTPIYWFVLSGLVMGTFVDFEHMIIPDRVTLGGILFGFIGSALVPALHGVTGVRTSLEEALIGCGVGVGLLWGVAIGGKLAFRKDAMGFGDVKLMGAIGAFFGWQAVIFTVFLSSLLGSLVGIGLIAAGKKEWQSRIPYGPYIALSAIVWMLYGQFWLELYRRWISGFQ